MPDREPGRRRGVAGATRIRITAVATAVATLIAVPAAVAGYAGVSNANATAIRSASLTQAQGISELLRTATLPAGYLGFLPYQVSDVDGRILATSGDLTAWQHDGAIGAGSWDATLPLSTPAAFSSLDTALALGPDRVTAIDTYTGIGAAEAAHAGLPVGARVRILVFPPPDSASPVLDNTRALLLVGVPLGVLLIGVAVWFSVGFALRPVDALRRRVARLSRSASETPRRIAEPPTRDEIQALASTLNEMLAELDRADARQRDFISDAAHELRTPVSSLLTTLEVATRYPGRVDAAETLETALRQTTRLQRLVADLLLSARLDGSGSPVSEPVDLGQVIVAVGRNDGNAGIPVRVALPRSRVVVPGSAAEIERLVQNLVDNARRHARSGVDVSLEVDPDDGFALLAVANDGEPIPAADRERVFERWVRLDPARPHSTGTGLGLAIVHQIARRHGGSVAVRSDAALTRFEVRFPAVRGDASP
jgi:signal transduction histidine kinase